MTRRSSFRFLVLAALSATLAATAWRAGCPLPAATATLTPSLAVESPARDGRVTELARLTVGNDAPLPRPVLDRDAEDGARADALAATLAGDDDAAKISAVEDAVRDGEVSELPALLRTSLARSPNAAPSIIHGVARLAVQGDAADAPVAARTLGRWLKEEQERDGRDAVGNVPNLIEALGALGGRDAVDALVALLVAPGRGGADRDLALETLAVQQLAGLGDPRARHAVEQFLGRVRGRPSTDDAFERELETEAAAAATEALERL